MEDLILDSNFDLEIKDGDLVIGKSDAQHLALLLESNQGEWKHNFLFGINLREELLNDSNITSIRHKIERQVKDDGGTVNKLEFVKSNLNASVVYE